MKTCKICGKAMDDSYNVCPYCGTPENVSPAEETQTNEQNNYQQNAYRQNPYSQQNNYHQPNFNTPPYTNAYSQPQHKPGYTPAPRPQRSAYIAAILSIIGGMFGLHNFYLDNYKTAKIQLVVSLAGLVLTFGVASIAMEVWAVIEGLRILKGEINTDGTGEMIKMGW